MSCVGLWLLLSISAAPETSPTLRSVKIVVPPAIGRSSFGTAPLIGALRQKLGTEVSLLEATGLKSGESAEPEALAQAGKRLGADYVLRIEVTKKRWLYTAHALLIDCQNGSLQMNFRSQYFKPRSEAKDRGQRIATTTLNKLRLISGAGSLSKTDKKPTASLQEIAIVVPKAIGQRGWGGGALVQSLRESLRSQVGAVVSRAKVRAAQRSLRLDRNSKNQPLGLALAGQAVGADYILRVEITRKRWLYTAHALLIDSQDGRIRMNFRSQYFKPTSEARDRGQRIAITTVKKLKKLLGSPALQRQSEPLAAVSEKLPEPTADTNASTQTNPGSGITVNTNAGSIAATPPQLEVGVTITPSEARGDLPVRTMVAAPMGARKISIDGKADDPGWKQIAKVKGFIQQDPDEGLSPTEPTVVYTTYDQESIYVLVEAWDSNPEKIVGWLTRRDESSASDWIHVWLDTYNDDRTAYRFSINPSGVKQDARLVDDYEDINWNAVWEGKVGATKDGWIAEFRIPFSQLGYDAGADSWGFQVGRDLSRRQERSYLNPIPRGATRLAQHFATLDGLIELPSERAVVVEPYVLGGVRLRDEALRAIGTVGGELRLALSDSLNFSLTINPDFGQFEADPSVLNLNATEVFFEERRAFFLDGQEFFDFRVEPGSSVHRSLFYTRRIGRRPGGEVRLANGETVVRTPDTTPIYGAVKMTGKTSDGWSIGILDALTGDAFSQVETPFSNASDRRLVEPLANAAVVRLAKDFAQGNTTAGLIGTHLVRRLTPETEGQFLQNALSGGADLVHRMGNYRVEGRAFGTYLQGSRETLESIQRSGVHFFQRPDADHLTLNANRTNLAGYGMMFTGGKFSGTHWRGLIGSEIFSPGFDPNPLGFLEQVDRQTGWMWLQYRDDKPGLGHRRFNISNFTFFKKTFGPELIELGTNLKLSWMFPNQYQVELGVGRDFDRLDVAALFGGPGLKMPGGWYGWLEATTDERKSLVVAIEGNWSKADSGAGSRLGLQLSTKYRPAPNLELQLIPSVRQKINDAQFVERIDTLNVIGHLEQLTASLTLRANLTLTPQMSLQVYAAPFITAGAFSDFRQVSDPRAANYADRFSPYDYEGSDRFVFAQVRSNVVFRWEYMLGSTLFLVWSHEQSLSNDQRGTIRLGEDLGDLFTAQPNDTVMLKLSHWFAL